MPEHPVSDYSQRVADWLLVTRRGQPSVLVNTRTGERQPLSAASPKPPPAPRKAPPPPRPPKGKRKLAQQHRAARAAAAPSSASAAAPPPEPPTREQMQAMNRQVGARVHEWRVLRGLSQERLAAQLGVTFQQLQKYESGANRIGAGRLYALAVALGVRVDQLFGAALVDELGKRETLELVRYYARIPAALRRHILDLVGSLADAAQGSAHDAKQASG